MLSLSIFICIELSWSGAFKMSQIIHNTANLENDIFIPRGCPTPLTCRTLRGRYPRPQWGSSGRPGRWQSWESEFPPHVVNQPGKEGDDYFQFDGFSDKFEREIDCWQEVKEVILCKSG